MLRYAAKQLVLSPVGRGWIVRVCLLLPLLAPGLGYAGIVVSPPVDPTEAATQWRWIGLMAPGSVVCPEPDAATGWTTEPMFPAARHTELARYCLYSRDDVGDSAPLFGLGLEQLENDHMAVAPEGSVLSDLTWSVIEPNFWEQAGRTALAGYNQSDAVRLTLIDTLPTAIASGTTGPEDLASTSPHGIALANIIRDLVCDDNETDCLAVVASRLALAYECFNANEPDGCRNEAAGGHIGLMGDLAKAIHDEVEDWANGGAGASHLILNLSVGWNARFGGQEVPLSDMPLDTQTVYLAIEYATCQGALVLAAAGNSQPGPNPEEGALFPAAWERYGSPTLARCEAVGITPPPEMSRFDSYRPFIHSAGGVQQGGLGVFNVRRKAEPRIVAIGDHAVVEFSDSTHPTTTLTGSSVATAVAASAAAVAWSQRSEFNSAEVMSLTHDASLLLGREPDYCLGGAPCPIGGLLVGRVSVCASLAEACVDGSCPVPSCANPTGLNLAGVDLSVFSDPSQATQLHLPDMADVIGVLPVCQNDKSRYDDSGVFPADPCPHYQYHGGTAEPWVEPQAQVVPCPNCLIVFDGSGTLYLEVDSDWVGALTEVTFKCGPDVFSFGVPSLLAGDKIRVTGIPDPCRTRDHLLLAFTVDGNRSAISAPHRVTQ